MTIYVYVQSIYIHIYTTLIRTCDAFARIFFLEEALVFCNVVQITNSIHFEICCVANIDWLCFENT